MIILLKMFMWKEGKNYIILNFFRVREGVFFRVNEFKMEVMGLEF